MFPVLENWNNYYFDILLADLIGKIVEKYGSPELLILYIWFEIWEFSDIEF